MLVEIRLPGATDRRTLRTTTEGTWEEADGGQAELGVGWWALPGLADAHSHLARDELDLQPGDPPAIRKRAFACLERGTFLVLDKGWSDTSVIATLTDLPPREAPDMEAAGRVVASPGGYYEGFAVETDAEGLAAVVATAAEEGRGWVKVIGDWPRKGRGAIPNFTPEQLATIVDIAHRGGARVAIHSMAPDVPTMAVEAGVDSIEHGLFLGPDDLDQLAAQGGAWVPTVTRMELMLGLLGAESSGGKLMAAGLANLRELLPAVPEGLVVLAGTDLATRPGDVATEVAALVTYGLDPRRAVDGASVDARRYTGRSPGFRPGEPADAVFYPADPYEDPGVLARPAAVIRAGERIA